MFRLAVECAADLAAVMRCAVSCLPPEFLLCRVGAHPLGGSQDPSGRVLDDPVMASHLYGGDLRRRTCRLPPCTGGSAVVQM